ncbi:hypothetical protein J4558_21245 [Leptolyngbya sp. 15MV]|nr:hypothetical protein J4558_21245 [Leptolyngbya sp. 15MV]
MLWRSSRREGLPDPAREFRRVHEEWLTRAMRSGVAYPRIPLRRVDAGGFDAMMARPEGRARARRWWSIVLDRLDPVEP